MSTRENQSANRKRAETASAKWIPRIPEIERLYYQEKFSMKEIGALYGVSQAAVTKWMKKLGFKSLGRGRGGEDHWCYKDGLSTRSYREMVKKVKCELCPATINLGVHHRDLDHFNNIPENLQVLCVSCHMSIHKKAYWDAKRKGLPTPKSNGRVGWQNGTKQSP